MNDGRHFRRMTTRAADRTGAARVHGGSDAAGVPRWDFSTCANAAGPCPQALAKVRAADVTRYPDPTVSAVRQALARLHDVEPWRVLPAVSASEFIQRITAITGRLWPGVVSVPRHAYGDYAIAAAAAGRTVLIDALPERAGPEEIPHASSNAVSLAWHADPGSPFGIRGLLPESGVHPRRRGVTVLDAVYEPLRLSGTSAWTVHARDSVFVLHSPNKALGLLGVRGAYAIAPLRAERDVRVCCEALEAAMPSWPLSAHGEAMLLAWTDAAVQAWVRDTHRLLGTWKETLQRELVMRGFIVHESDTPFFIVHPPRYVEARALRQFDIAVRDTRSFGLPGCWRVAARPPEEQKVLLRAIDRIRESRCS